MSQGKLNPRAKKGYFLGYPIGVKGYKIWLIEDKKAIISRDVIFNEYVFYKTNMQGPKQQELFGATSQDFLVGSHMASKENQFETDEHRDEDVDLGGDLDHNIEDQDQTDVQDVEPTSEDLGDYVLSRDRVRRHIKPPTRYAQADLIAFALSARDVVELDEPLSYSEATRSPD